MWRFAACCHAWLVTQADAAENECEVVKRICESRNIKEASGELGKTFGWNEQWGKTVDRQ